MAGGGILEGVLHKIQGRRTSIDEVEGCEEEVPISALPPSTLFFLVHLSSGQILSLFQYGSGFREKLYLPEGVAVSLRIRSRGAKSLEATKYRPTTSEVATLMGKHSGGRCNSSKCSWEQNHAWWQVWHSMEEADFPHK